MTPESVGPLSRPISVAHLPEEGLDVTVEASEEERAALAADFKLPAIGALTGSFHVSGSPHRVRVTGRVTAAISQICVVTLDPFDSDLEEEVEIEFAEPGTAGTAAPEAESDTDELRNGHVDLGALTAEFLALGLDPYPRKPGSDFTFEAAGDQQASPFAVLKKLRGGD